VREVVARQRSAVADEAAASAHAADTPRPKSADRTRQSFTEQ